MSLFDNDKNKLKKPYTSSLTPLELTKWKLPVIIEKIRKKEINPDPIGQRPPTSSPKKTKEVSSQIIETMFKGYSIGSIILRDISNDKVSQEVYFDPDEEKCTYRYLVIDGGHRIRAIRSFINKEIDVFGLSFEQHLREYEKNRENCHPGFIHFYEEYELLIEIYQCNESQSGDIFKARNKSTPVNDMEMIMSNETSYVAEQIRKRVTFYKEYLNKYGENTVLQIFRGMPKNINEEKPRYWTTDFNPRRKWDEYVAVIYLKSIAENNCEASYEMISNAIESSSYAMENPDPAKVKQHMREVDSNFKKVDKFFEDFKTVIENCGKGKNPAVNNHFFGAFQCIYFRYMEKFGFDGEVFEFDNIESFAKEFNKFHVLLTGSVIPKQFSKFKDSDLDYNDRLYKFPLTQITDLIKVFCRKNVIAFSNKLKQDDTADFYIKESNLSEFVKGVQKTRTVSRRTKEELLIYQNGVCYTDGKPLSLENAVFGHDLAYKLGGKLAEGAIIRDLHNSAMSDNYTMEQYNILWKTVSAGQIDAAKFIKEGFDMSNRAEYLDKWKPSDIVAKILDIQQKYPELV